MTPTDLMHNPMDARCVFVVGPVAVFINQAPQAEILEAYAEIEKYVRIAAEQLGAAHNKEVTSWNWKSNTGESLSNPQDLAPPR